MAKPVASIFGASWRIVRSVVNEGASTSSPVGSRIQPAHTMAIMAISVAASQSRWEPERCARYDIDYCFPGQTLKVFNLVACQDADAKGVGKVTGILAKYPWATIRRRLTIGKRVNSTRTPADDSPRLAVSPDQSSEYQNPWCGQSSGDETSDIRRGAGLTSSDWLVDGAGHSPNVFVLQSRRRCARLGQRLRH